MGRPGRNTPTVANLAPGLPVRLLGAAGDFGEGRYHRTTR